MNITIFVVSLLLSHYFPEASESFINLGSITTCWQRDPNYCDSTYPLQCCQHRYNCQGSHLCACPAGPQCSGHYCSPQYVTTQIRARCSKSTALQWFQSYLWFLHINTESSAHTNVNYTIPYGSVLMHAYIYSTQTGLRLPMMHCFSFSHLVSHTHIHNSEFNH